ncbi:DUF1674 domain-containing protein [Solimonas variicoloris]|uniref:DUF1674 domain-containing protein n=1 Tax=Solimonas variicoloris TaxID=254408 RepID=UPI0003A1B298|nr:succinate dehydrogenase assembly factor 4 [Solimonas variicoloris]
MPDDSQPVSAASAEPIALADLLRQAPAEAAPDRGAAAPPASGQVREIGGRRDGPEPTRYGDWEKNGRCIDF